MERLVEARVAQRMAAQHADAQRDRLNRQMEMAMLQAQINPHFLYNTLECIRGQALAAEASDIADTTQALSRYFRYSISSRSDVVPLKDELDNVRNYMKIQQYRFRDRFSLHVSLHGQEAEVLDCLLPKLTLQPIVENAVVHGFANKIDDARVSIQITRTARHVSIVVSDNGQGMNPEELKALRDSLRGEAPSRQPGHGIAMGNVKKRLQLFFGTTYGLTVGSVAGIGTDVEIYIPYRS